MPLSAHPPIDAKAALARAHLLRGLGDAELAEIAKRTEWLFLPGGEMLLHPASVSDGIFIVVSGRLQISEGANGSEYAVREVAVGGNVGELTLLTGEPSLQTVRAVRDTHLARLSRSNFEQLAKAYPSLALALAYQLSQLHRRSTSVRAPGEIPATIAVVPLSRDAPVHEFVVRLEEAFSPLGRVRRLTAETLADDFGGAGAVAGQDDLASAEASHWLNALEHEYGLIIYEAASESSAWSRRCVRQADHVLAVALADAGPRDEQLAPGFFDAIAGRQSVNVDLVLLHTDGSLRPRLTSVWRALHPFAAHHHLRMTMRSDFERLMRHLSGRAVGLVLSGGGARAFAQGGVLRALEEVGIPVDIIGGTSAGGLVAAHYAFGYDVDTIIELNRAWSERHLLDYTIPLVALLSARRPKRILERAFGDARIEDLWLPFFCVSTDLTHAELVIHRTGSIAKCVRASLSVPGVMPPAMSEMGDMLVDGAILNNLPIDVMRRLTTGPIIAVDVCPTDDIGFGRGHRHTPPPWQQVLDAAKSQEKAHYVPPIFRILHRTALLRSERRRRETQGEADLYLTPPVTEFDMFDWSNSKAMVNIGYRYAAPLIKEWKSRLPPIVASVRGSSKPARAGVLSRC